VHRILFSKGENALLPNTHIVMHASQNHTTRGSVCRSMLQPTFIFCKWCIIYSLGYTDQLRSQYVCTASWSLLIICYSIVLYHSRPFSFLKLIMWNAFRAHFYRGTWFWIHHEISNRPWMCK
jgi:hypothetical protein